MIIGELSQLLGSRKRHRLTCGSARALVRTIRNHHLTGIANKLETPVRVRRPRPIGASSKGQDATLDRRRSLPVERRFRNQAASFANAFRR